MKVIEELEELPEGLIAQVLDYVRILKQNNERFDTTIVSEPSLSKDWNSKDEDEAWKEL
ncbi:MAG: hypothetical protein JXR22_07710 [Prolixibacteraceae bacterium]|nr:hypothetical protein [Prolixibacteraceae bacterium]